MGTEARKYVIGSGWWCENEDGHLGRKGSPFIRSVRFHEKIWLPLLLRYTNPTCIIIVDSKSPVLPRKNEVEQWISLDKNYGLLGGESRFNGWIKGFMFGAAYAWNCDADYFYVEQDCIAVGPWIKKVYEKDDRKHVMVGQVHMSGKKTLSWGLQQSLVFIPHGLILGFLYGIQKAVGKACEQKFANANVPLSYLPFGYGRLRPINFNDTVFYAQHWSLEELDTLLARERMTR